MARDPEWRDLSRQVIAVDGQPLPDADWLGDYIARQPVGSEVRHRLRRGDPELERTIATRIFTGADFILLSGSHLVRGPGLARVALI